MTRPTDMPGVAGAESSAKPVLAATPAIQPMPPLDTPAFLRLFQLRAAQITCSLGAGSSRSAGIKTAGDMIWDFKQRLYRSQKKLPPSAITDIGEPAVQRKLQAHFACVAAFAEKMRSVREHVAQSKKLSYKYQKEAWLLDALEIYCVAVSSLFAEAKLQRPSSPGFAGLLGYLADYVELYRVSRIIRRHNLP